MRHNLFDSFQSFDIPAAGQAGFYSLPALEAAGLGRISRLPVSLRIVLESVLRNCDGKSVTQAHVRQLAGWQPNAPRQDEIPFVLARIVLQDFTGVPLLCDLAAMRGAAARLGRDPGLIEPLVPVHLVVDHSVQVDYYNAPDAFRRNMEIEFERNGERYQFLKWGMQAFDTFKVVPPGIGIVHQVNLEYLARGVWSRDGVYYPDTLVGTDSHTTMINGIGVVGWGVGGIEAEAAMLGQPLYLLTPDVVGVHLSGRLGQGVTATDLVLTVTEMLRSAKVVGKFVEFFGDGVAALSVPDRATIGNMAPEYGATIGFFPIDDAAVAYLTMTGRSQAEVAAFQSYFKAQGLYGAPQPGEIDYSTTLALDLASIRPSVAGPRRPQDRIPLPELGAKFDALCVAPVAQGGFGKDAAQLKARYPTRFELDAVTALAAGGGDQHAKQGMARSEVEMVDDHPTPTASAGDAAACNYVNLGQGDVLIAAITSCTNTSNPGVLLAAGLLAKKAVERGLTVQPHIKTSLAPGSRVVTEYLRNAGLLPYLEQLGFGLVAYGCTTCIGNSGPLDPCLEEIVVNRDLICAAVLSGNRNFEARIHASIKANFLMSPPLVVAFAIAGRVNLDLEHEPLGQGKDGLPVYLKDIWPSPEEIAAVQKYATDPAMYRRLYADFTQDNPLWNGIAAPRGDLYHWAHSTYIAEPPFFQDFGSAAAPAGNIVGARALGIFGDSVTTDHISPAGSIKASSPAGQYLQAHGVAQADFNSYGARRGNHEVMVRGTFANVRIRNLLIPPAADGSRVEGGVTLHQPDRAQMPIFDAAMQYIADRVPTLVFAGEEYGSGSSRDWAAKGTQLLGVKAVIARSFERIHRSNLVGMNVLPLQFKGADSVQSLAITGDERFDILGLEGVLQPQQDVTLVIHRVDGASQQCQLLLRIDTPIEVDYIGHGGILPYVLQRLLA
ncbi:aconitate hydratase [Herminiimonas sp. CN]|uniref:aconitate hydratase n=1 Tax=Herminiimonas sp. CN TaxID=1349818 RepID=UPI00047399BE|nr:aconitate hydratase [Herminiimonas sp. CN]